MARSGWQRLLTWVLCLGLALACIAPARAHADEQHRPADGVLVLLADGADVDALAQELPVGAEPREISDGVVRVEIDGLSPEEAAEAIADSELVELAQPDYIYEIAATAPNDPRFSDQWALKSVKAPCAWELTDASAVTVAALDTGANVSHEDLAESIDAVYNAYDGTEDISDANGHGTLVAGILAATTGNAKGVASASGGARLLPIKVVDENSQARTSSLVAAYDYVLEHAEELNIRVINISMVAAADPAAYSDSAFLAKIDEAWEAGIVTVAAAGNGGSDGPYDAYPGDYHHVVSVINLMQTGGSPQDVERNPDSNYNKPGESDKNISAPGTGILSTNAAGGYSSSTGTSMAAPHVSAALALIFAADPSLSADEAVAILYESARDLGEEGFDEQYGWGEVDLNAAVCLALGLPEEDCEIEPAPEPEPVPEPEPAPEPEPVPAPPADEPVLYPARFHGLLPATGDDTLSPAILALGAAAGAALIAAAVWLRKR